MYPSHLLQVPVYEAAGLQLLTLLAHEDADVALNAKIALRNACESPKSHSLLLNRAPDVAPQVLQGLGERPPDWRYAANSSKLA